MAIKVPGVKIGISDLRESSAASANIKVLIIGMRLAAGTVAALTATRIVGDEQAISAFGRGSQIAQMCQRFRAQAPRVHLTAIAIDENGAGTAAVGTVTITGSPTTANPLYLQVEDSIVEVPIAIGDSVTAMAASAVTELDSEEFADLHVTATSALGVVTFTARSNGPHGNEINLRVLSTPPGVSAVAAAMATGATAGDIDPALAVLGGVRYDLIVLPSADATALTDIEVFLDDRWLAANAIDGHAIVGRRDTVANLVTLGESLDTKHTSIFGDPKVPSNPWVQAAVVAAARAAKTNPKTSIRNVPLVGIVAPLETEYLDPDDRDALLQAGIACYHYIQGRARVDRFPTLAKTNDLGLDSDAVYDLETKRTVSAIRQEQIRALTPLIGKILVDDASDTAYDLDTGREIIDPEGIRQVLISQYNIEFQSQGWVGDPAGFAAELEVTKISNSAISYVCVPRINGINYVTTGTIEFVLA